MNKFDNQLAYINRHEQFLREFFAEIEIPAPRLGEAIIYSIFPGGKRLRPLLVYLIGELFSTPLPCLDVIAAAVELTHCYSLVHDDLPAMDNDDMRRGKPSCHKAYDEATAILVGDGLQALAIEILLKKLPLYLQPQQVIAVTTELIKASGTAGMVSGQSLDLTEMAQTTLQESQLRTIHQLKTGQLILACANMVLASSPESKATSSSALQKFATELGLVFQMQDDYLDQYAQQSHGKGRSSDSENQKMTFAGLYSKENLQSLINHHYQLAREALACFNNRAEPLLMLLQELQQRGE